MMYRIICLFILFAISLATDVTVYKSVDYPLKIDPDPLALSQFPLKFQFQRNLSHIIMKIYLKNTSSSVTGIHITYESDAETIEATSHKDRNDRRRNETYYMIRQDPIKLLLKINLELSGPKIFCPPILVAEGRVLSQFTNETTKEFKSIDGCISYICELEVDLRNVCQDHSSATDTITDDVNTTMRDKNLEIRTNNNTALHTKDTSQLSSDNVVLIYVIPSVMVACIIILVIYKSVKKYYHRNPVSKERMEINTYVTINEVVYADLSLAHGDSHPGPNKEAEYAQIIGVLKPIDANMEKK